MSILLIAAATSNGEPSTRQHAPGQRSGYSSMKLDELTKRGLISLVCNVSTNGWGRGLAEQNKLEADAVQTDLRANLIPGAILVPSGIYALIRAQNAGCAFMRGM